MFKGIDIGSFIKADLFGRLEARYRKGLGKRVFDIVLFAVGVSAVSLLMERPFDQWVVPIFSFIETRIGDAVYVEVVKLFVSGLVAIAAGVVMIVVSEWWRQRRTKPTKTKMLNREYPLDEN